MHPALHRCNLHKKRGMPLARKYWKTLWKSEVLFLSIRMILLAIQGGVWYKHC